jgi:hypothetical protein
MAFGLIFAEVAMPMNGTLVIGLLAVVVSAARWRDLGKAWEHKLVLSLVSEKPTEDLPPRLTALVLPNQITLKSATALAQLFLEF